MDTFDKETAARVWARVQRRDSSGELPGAPVRPEELVWQAHALAGLYLGLGKRATGKTGRQVGELYHRHRQLTACLRGICRMGEGAMPGLPPMKAGDGPLPKQLEACYHRELRLLEGLTRLAAEGNSPVYGLLSRQAAERCLTVLAMLGGG